MKGGGEEKTCGKPLTGCDPNFEPWLRKW